MPHNALVVGVGGLGCSAAPVLHAAGIELTLCDFDRVEERNLGRQDLYDARDVGRFKVDAAVERLPGAHILDRPFDADDVTGHDVVLDCTDEPGTRALIHQACLDAGVPLVWAAVGRDVGQVATIVPGAGPCLRCLWAGVGEPTPCDTDTDAAALRSTGRMQAEHALGVLQGDPRPGILQLLDDPPRTIRFHRRPDCPTCKDL